MTEAKNLILEDAIDTAIENERKYRRARLCAVVFAIISVLLWARGK